MNEWVQNRIRQIKEDRKEELEEFFEEQWEGYDSEDAEERLSVYYSEDIIPDAIERLRYESGWDEECIEAFQEINAAYPFWNLSRCWDEIEKKYPRYIEDIRIFFQPYIDDYEQGMEAEKARYVSESVEAELENESEGIKAQAEAELEEL